jgi:hypothetical protein
MFGEGKYGQLGNGKITNVRKATAILVPNPNPKGAAGAEVSILQVVCGGTFTGIIARSEATSKNVGSHAPLSYQGIVAKLHGGGHVASYTCGWIGYTPAEFEELQNQPGGIQRAGGLTRFAPLQALHSDGTHPLQLAAGDRHMAALVACADDHHEGDSASESCRTAVFTWGHEVLLGFPDENTRRAPCRLSMLDERRIVQVACGHGHTVALSSNGKMYAWGDGRFAQTGSGEFKDKLVPQSVTEKPFQFTPVQVACGAYSTLVLGRATPGR